MAEANTKHTKVYLEENVKRIKLLPHDMVRLCSSYEILNKKYEENVRSSHDAFQALKDETMKEENKENMNEWTLRDDECFKHLNKMRKCEDDMMMFQDEKIALLTQNITNIESLITKMTKDLNQFEKILQPNMIKLPYPNKKM